MFLPHSHFACVLLLVLSLVLFCIWPNLYKQVQGRWRYELFALDFAVGSLAIAVLLAYTLGTLGPEMSFTDRLLIAGRSSAVLIIGAGIVFALSLLLLFGSISLLGLAGALPVSFGIAGTGAALLRMRGTNTVALLAGALLMLISVGVAWTAVNAAASAGRRTNAPKGLAMAVLSGLLLIGVQAVMRITSDPEFGPGPYATALMFAIGLFLATPCLDFFFMNIKVVGSQISFASYTGGGLKTHLPGLLAGTLWTCGLIALYLAFSATGTVELSRPLVNVLPGLAVPLVILLGLQSWHEFEGASARARSLLRASALCFSLGLAAVGFGLAA